MQIVHIFSLVFWIICASTH